MGKAIVSTRLGAEGLDVTHEKNLLLADEASDFANQAVRVARDQALREVLGRNARQLAEEIRLAGGRPRSRAVLRRVVRSARRRGDGSVTGQAVTGAANESPATAAQNRGWLALLLRSPSSCCSRTGTSRATTLTSLSVSLHNLANGLGFSFNPGEATYGSTAPIWWR